MSSTVIQKDQPRSIEHEALTMALGIIAQRIHGLPKEDREDLYQLVKELGNSDTQEEVESIVITMREILDQAPLKLQTVDVAKDVVPSNGLRKWIQYVGQRIRELRAQANMTQKELEEKSGLPQSHISRLENGEHSPSHATLQKIADALGVPVSQLDPSAD